MFVFLSSMVSYDNLINLLAVASFILLSEIIDNSPEKDSIYNALGLVKTEKAKKVKKEKLKKEEKIIVKEYIEKTFQLVKV